MSVLWPFSKKLKPEPTSPLTESHDEALKVELGMGVLQALDNHATIAETARKNRLWNNTHLAFLRKSKGIGSPIKDEDMPATTVRIDSDNHYHGGGNVLPWILAAALGSAGLAHFLTKPAADKPPVVAPSDPNTKGVTDDVRYVPPGE